MTVDWRTARSTQTLLCELTLQAAYFVFELLDMLQKVNLVLLPYFGLLPLLPDEVLQVMCQICEFFLVLLRVLLHCLQRVNQLHLL